MESDKKQEAIEWVKRWFTILDNPEYFIKDFCVGFKRSDMDKMNITQRECCGSIGAFINFFNITEEDLRWKL